MSLLTDNPTIKEINAFKKKLTWGEIPTIYHLVTSSIAELDGILTDGFDNPYKRLLNPNNWNLPLLGGFKDEQGNIQVKNKAKICIRHEYNDMGYELHCYPIIKGDRVLHSLINKANSPFSIWHPESMQMLFRINSLVAFSIYTYKNGDDADNALIKYAFLRVEKLIQQLEQAFTIVEVKGYNIAKFYQEILIRNGDIIEDNTL